MTSPSSTATKAGGMIRTQIPRFRLPEEVIDEESATSSSWASSSAPASEIESMKAPCWPRATTRSSSVPARRAAATSTAGPQGSRRQHPHRHRLAVVGLVRPHREDRQARHRAGRRQHRDGLLPHRARLGGEDVKVIVRSGFEEMKASPWEKEDAMHEGIPILNFLVPKAFLHENGKLTGMTFEKVKAEYDDKGRRSWCRPASRTVRALRRRAVAVGQENAFPWIERDIGIEFDKWGMPVVDKKTCSRPMPACSSAATRPSAPRTSSGRSRTATRRPCRSTSS
jgi:formate dehydrogenase beta subunit